MVFHDRSIILVDGAVTAVVAFLANASERASAYASHSAAGFIERVRRDAEGGDRHTLVDMFQLISEAGIFGFSPALMALPMGALHSTIEARPLGRDHHAS